MLDQQQRHQYLEALGITSWLPTQALPAAAPSADWVWDFRYPAPEIPFSDTPAAGGNRAAATKPAAPKMDAAKARAALNDTLALVADSGKQKPAARKAEPEAKPVAKPKPRSTEIPRFKLAMLAMGDWLVIDSLPTASADGFSERHQQLLKNISVFLGPDIPPLPRAAVLNWPMLANSSLDQSRPEAVSAVRYKLKQMQSKSGANHLLLLGEIAAQMVLDSEASLDDLRGLVTLPQHPQLKTLVSHSLSELLSLPEMKAVFWQDLQTLLNG